MLQAADADRGRGTNHRHDIDQSVPIKISDHLVEVYDQAAWQRCRQNHIKRGFEPDVVFTHYRSDRHQDHRLLSDLAWNTFRNHLVLEYEIPKYDGDLGLPNCFFHINEEDVNKKVEILLECFPTQAGKHWFDRETFLSLMRVRGLESASPTRYAEAFHARKMVFSR